VNFIKKESKNMARQFRVEREWVPLKQYLPTRVYAQLLDLIQNDVIYKDLHRVGNEQLMNAMILHIIMEWLEYRPQIEEMTGTAGARQAKVKSINDMQAYIDSLHRDAKNDGPTQPTLNLDPDESEG
jgi:hypothetical protein